MSFAVEALASFPSVCAVDANGLDLLSKREMDVVRSLAEGLTNREIAERLGLSQHTIKNYLFRVFDKLGVSSRLELLFMTLTQAGALQTSFPDEPQASEQWQRQWPSRCCGSPRTRRAKPSNGSSEAAKSSGLTPGSVGLDLHMRLVTSKEGEQTRLRQKRTGKRRKSANDSSNCRGRTTGLSGKVLLGGCAPQVLST